MNQLKNLDIKNEINRLKQLERCIAFDSESNSESD